MNKKEAANIIHEYLLARGEADEDDFTDALKLKDLYDCPKCIRHIAQVYVKGIIQPESERIFGTEVYVSQEEFDQIKRRADNPSERIMPAKYSPSETILYITRKAAENLQEIDPDVMMVDVRTLSLRELNLNPVMFCSDLYQPIVLYCERGYASTFAADILLKYGFKKVYVIRESEHITENKRN